MKKKSVLLLGAAGTQTLPIAESLYKSGFIVHLFLYKKYSYGSGTKYAHFKVFAPTSNNEKEYMGFLLDYLSKKEIDVIIPLSDVSADYVSKYQMELEKTSRVVAPSYETFSQGYHKEKLMQLCEKHNYPHPNTISLLQKYVSEIKNDFYPSILKPNITTGGRGMHKLFNRTDLEQVYETTRSQHGDCHLQKLIKLGGSQFKVQLFVDQDLNLIGSSVMEKVRFYPVKGGSSAYNVTIQRDDLVSICYKVLKNLNWYGFADFDIIHDPDDGKDKILEINPRLPACIKSAFSSGMNYAQMYIDEALGNKHQIYNYQPGHHLRHLGLDTMWFVKVDKSRTKDIKKWFNFFQRNTKYQDFSISDLKSFAFGTYANISKH